MSDFDEQILHVDMDAFFVEVERLRRPELKGRPVVVGGAGARGVVASASYEARRFGIGSAMPMSRARRLCPGLVIVGPDHHEYERVSAKVFDIFRSFTPVVEGLSLDEAFLDVSGLRRHYPDAVTVGNLLRTTIRSTLDLPASVGVADNKFLAKLASEAAKPDGLVHVPVGQGKSFLAGLPVEALPGVGRATLASLENLGVVTVGDLAQIPCDTLQARLGVSLGSHLFELAAGRDQRPVVPDSAAKSISVEETYPTDLTTPAEIEIELIRLSVRLAGRMYRMNATGHTVTLKVRYPDFTTINRSVTSPVPVVGEHAIYRLAKELLARSGANRSHVRLLGIGISKLDRSGEQSRFDLSEEGRWSALSPVLEDVRERFGSGAVGPASLTSSGRTTRSKTYTEQGPVTKE